MGATYSQYTESHRRGIAAGLMERLGKQGPGHVNVAVELKVTRPRFSTAIERQLPFGDLSVLDTNSGREQVLDFVLRIIEEAASSFQAKQPKHDLLFGCDSTLTYNVNVAGGTSR